ncbi:hypothetical protein FQA39_LY18508 [Lamprigera yunnana]|nr:hypothetical protein FQA39_LY18508 [Lamprigera yunnana]
MFFILLSVFLLAFLYFLRFVYQEYKFNKHLVNFQGPKMLPIIGIALEFKSPIDIFPLAMEMQKQYSGFAKLNLGLRPRLIALGSKEAELMLTSLATIEKSYEYNFFHDWLGTGLLTSSGSKWKHHRKLITPTFHFQILKEFLTIFDKQSNIFIQTLSENLDGKPFDVFPLVIPLTLDIICEAAMGTQVNAQTKSDNNYVLSVKAMCAIIIERIFSPLKMINSLYKLTYTYYKQKKYLSIIHGYTNSVITARRNNLSKKTNVKTNNIEEVKQRLAFLDLLLQYNMNEDTLSMESIREEVDTFMFEGHDTTASGISFTLYCLSQNKYIQDKVSAELDQIFSDDQGRSATLNDLQDMKYLEMVIKESLRLYPPVPAFSRRLKEDTPYENEILPKGLVLTLLPVSLHRDEKFFPDPEKFDPERFSPENMTKRSPYVYVPFSAGPRNCIGQRFAILEMKSVISKVLRHFELLGVPNHTPILSIEIILKSHNGLPIRLRKRR